MADSQSTDQPHPQRVTKLEGAERLLKTAIHLFFDDEDMLAVHALTAGAHEVLHTLLSKKNGGTSSIKDHSRIRPERLKEYITHLNRTQNFLKHADRDHDQVLDYYKEATPYWIFDAVITHLNLTGNFKFQAFVVFFGWFLIEHPFVLKEGSYAESVNLIRGEGPWDKNYFKELLRNPQIGALL